MRTIVQRGEIALEEAGKGRVRGCGAHFQTAALKPKQRRRLGARGLLQFLNQARLTDAGLAAQQDHAADAGLEIPQRSIDDSDFTRSTDQGCSPPFNTMRTARTATDALQGIHLIGSAQGAEVNGTRSDADRTPRQVVGLPAEQHFVAAGQIAEPRRPVDDRAQNRRLLALAGWRRHIRPRPV